MAATVCIAWAGIQTDYYEQLFGAVKQQDFRYVQEAEQLKAAVQRRTQKLYPLRVETLNLADTSIGFGWVIHGPLVATRRDHVVQHVRDAS